MWLSRNAERADDLSGKRHRQQTKRNVNLFGKNACCGALLSIHPRQ
jgi:hypothetical protein